VYNQGYPSYTVTVTKTTQGAVTVKLVQTQSHASVNFFEMPVPVRLTGANGQTLDVVLDNTFNNQTFTVPVTFNVTDAEVNAGYDIITGNNAVTLSTPSVTSNPEFVLYPNPAVNMLNVQVPNGIEITHAIIYNMLGQKVLETSGSSAFNVSALSAGAHILKLQTTQGSEQMRFIKQ